MRKTKLIFTAFICSAFLSSFQGYAQYVNLQLLGTYQTGVYDEGAAEIATHDAATQRLFSVNANTGGIDVLDISFPETPAYLFSIDLSAYGASANSVASRNGIIAAAVENFDRQANGNVVFFNADGEFLAQYEVGALPDMLTFSPNGKLVLVANEGEPSDDYLNDPIGSVSVIDITGGIIGASVTQIDFTAFSVEDLDPAIKINGPGTVAQDLEPEYIAVSHNNKYAYVTLQENNAVAIINLVSNTVESILPLGFKDHSLVVNAMDASDKNGGVVNITTWPVYGMYQPDAIAFLKVPGYGGYLITANEGDARDYEGFSELARVKDLVLDLTAFPDAATLQLDDNLGRLNVTTSFGDTDEDGDFDELYSFGARSFSVWSAITGELVYDSGDDLEQITYAAYPANFNASNSSNTKKGRSDDKGPEPEGLALGEVLGNPYLFLGLERIGGVMVYDLSNPTAPAFVQYFNNRDFTFGTSAPESGDQGPEGLLFIPGNKSPNGRNMLVVSNEVSGTISFYNTDYQCGKNKVLVCYEGVTYCLAIPVAEALISIGATLGECISSGRYGEVVEQEIISSGITVFPNPATTYFNVISESLIPGYWEFELTDVTGRVVASKSITIAGFETIPHIVFNTGNIANGTYILNAISANGISFNEKVIINK
ncbi:MAG: choice-of-anchor I family protein [Chitinophagales bacterium]